jgi:hypothetical protein
MVNQVIRDYILAVIVLAVQKNRGEEQRLR